MPLTAKCKRSSIKTLLWIQIELANRITAMKDKATTNLLLEKYITYKELSERLNISVKTLQDWVYRRRIPHRKLGRLVRFDPSEIHSWANERYQDGNFN